MHIYPSSNLKNGLYSYQLAPQHSPSPPSTSGPASFPAFLSSLGGEGFREPSFRFASQQHASLNIPFGGFHRARVSRWVGRVKTFLAVPSLRCSIAIESLTERRATKSRIHISEALAQSRRFQSFTPLPIKIKSFGAVLPASRTVCQTNQRQTKMAQPSRFSYCLLKVNLKPGDPVVVGGRDLGDLY